MTKTLELKALLIRQNLNQEQVAKELGITVPTFNYKLNNKKEFKASEIKKLSEILQMTAEEVNNIFFAEE